ncbi:Ribbon-helix-helix protein, copG family [Hoeflea phototrophica DFL-43]|uniref:Ribbon-helix-helix protein, copG family n=1 Tax=Hoeflea phototrophica (strain DSM 17068 / NCIMB 14078 / DFL-43) TaxID=411684 RepID=A9CTW1_HOEPD|nr:ribbon-helix-helix protein, CopG family [Hoeflea phototrophica]EDQ35115.2 Ribbon-helix-helix protein, copG family [Hoeflea phototrophica DFL-43]
MSAVIVRVPDENADRLEQLAAKQDRSRAYMAAKAIEDFVAREERQLAEIEAGVGEGVNQAAIAVLAGSRPRANWCWRMRPKSSPIA